MRLNEVPGTQTFTLTQVTAFDTEVNIKALVYRDNKSDRHREKERARL